MAMGRPTISFEQLLEKLATTTPVFGGEVPMIVQIELHHAKRLASNHQISDSIKELQTEVREIREILDEAVQKMSTLLEQSQLQTRSITESEREVQF